MIKIIYIYDSFTSYDLNINRYIKKIIIIININKQTSNKTPTIYFMLVFRIQNS